MAGYISHSVEVLKMYLSKKLWKRAKSRYGFDYIILFDLHEGVDSDETAGKHNT